MNLTIHSDWDAEKALAHLDQLRADAERDEAIADAFEEAADGYRREASRRLDQVAHCERMFAKPRPSSPKISDLRTVSAVNRARHE
jgi:hypothetical protein